MSAGDAADQHDGKCDGSPINKQSDVFSVTVESSPAGQDVMSDTGKGANRGELQTCKAMLGYGWRPKHSG